MHNKIELIKIVFSRFDFQIDLSKEEITYEIKKNATCNFSKDESLNRVLVAISFSAKAEDEEAFHLFVDAHVELQMDCTPSDDEKEDYIRSTILPFADSVTSERVQNALVAMGHSSIDLST